MANWFDRSLKVPKVKHSVFDLSNDYKTSIGIGKLVPVYVEECLPSDKFLSVRQESFLRFAPLLYPLMHRVHVKSTNFFVPIRILLGDSLYEDFLNNRKDISSMRVLFAKENYQNKEQVHSLLKNSLIDYLGFDININTIQENSTAFIYEVINPLALLGYASIVQNWYCDEVLNASTISAVDSVIDQYRTCMNSGTDFYYNWYHATENFLVAPFNVAYSRDYFTSARPTPIQGPDQYVLNNPLNTSIDVQDVAEHAVSRNGNGNLQVYIDGKVNIRETTTIRELWRREQLQRFFEQDNKFGSRIREKLAGHFGVTISDKRLMIPRYLGGTSSIAQVSEVVQTSSSTEDSALGNYAGKATAFNNGFSKPHFCEEHGFYYSLLSVVPELGYCQGNPRYFYKKNIFDYASPEFNNIGWQSIYNGEVFAGIDDKGEFAYQPRYSEYRAHKSIATGEFRSGNLLSWHMNRNFSSLPSFNDNFIKIQQSDINRIFAYEGTMPQSECPIFIDVYNHVKVSRPIAYEPDSLHLY